VHDPDDHFVRDVDERHERAISLIVVDPDHDPLALIASALAEVRRDHNDLSTPGQHVAQFRICAGNADRGRRFAFSGHAPKLRQCTYMNLAGDGTPATLRTKSMYQPLGQIACGCHPSGAVAVSVVDPACAKEIGMTRCSLSV